MGSAVTRALVLLPLLLATLGCDKLISDARATEPPPAASKPKQQEKAEKHHDHADDGALRYSVPFAWEVSKDEPLAKTRAYLGDLLADNAAHANRGAGHFQALRDAQSPRATVVACADSRVQASAWDATPENDAFTIRNIGNQVKPAHGSVEYALEHLHTPVLVILGHTGCGAVKAAMGKLEGLSAPIREELKDMKLPEADPKANESQAWAAAVIANVNAQVAFAVTKFGRLLREERVTVVGAVYDLRNDLGRGYGRISVVNVNGNVEPERLKAFESALQAPVTSKPELARSPESRRTEADVLAHVNDLIKARSKLSVSVSVPPGAPRPGTAANPLAKVAPSKPLAGALPKAEAPGNHAAKPAGHGEH